MRIETQAARNTDPETSHMAAEAITKSGKRESHARAALFGVKQYPGRTSAELAFALGMDRHETARRLADLKGVKVRQGEKKECRVSGKMCVTWELIDGLEGF